jgi:hypothetical protein
MNQFVIMKLFELPVVRGHPGDVAIILARICPTKATAEIQELALGLIEGGKSDMHKFLKDLFVSLNQVSAADPDLNPQEREHIFQTLNRHEGPTETVPRLFAQTQALSQFSMSEGLWRF